MNKAFLPHLKEKDSGNVDTSYEDIHTLKSSKAMSISESPFRHTLIELGVNTLFIQPKLKRKNLSNIEEKEADRKANYVTKYISSAREMGHKPTLPLPNFIPQKSFSAYSKLLTPNSISQKLKQKKGLSPPVEAVISTKIESAFGVDFTNVRIHKGKETTESNQKSASKAFTHRFDIYFNARQYNPDTREGQHLLTHATQQSTNAIQRKADETTNTSRGQIQTIFGQANNYLELSMLIFKGIVEVSNLSKKVPDSHPSKARAQTLIEEAQILFSITRQQGIEEHLSSFAIAQSSLWNQEAQAVINDLNRTVDQIHRKEADELAQLAKEAAIKSEELKKELNNALRSAFSNGDENKIRQIASTIITISDLTVGFHDLARKSFEAIADFKAVNVPVAGQFVEMIKKLNKALALFNIGWNLTGQESITELEKGVNSLNSSISIANSLATFLGTAPHIGIYISLYIGPSLQIISSNLKVIANSKREENDDWVALLGSPTNFSVEPGGDLVWEFMIKVMKANSESNIPPSHTDVAKYFKKHKNRFQAGLREKISNSKWWKRTDLNSPEGKTYIFNNRDMIWSMLYGNREIPR